MAGKQAKILSDDDVDEMLAVARQSRHPMRNQAIILLSAKAGLRAAEIANLTWPMVLQADGRVGSTVELQDAAAKKRHGRSIPMHPMLRHTLEQLSAQSDPEGHCIRSERGGKMRALSIVVWFNRMFKHVGLQGCSSHSGRRTFITRAARLAHRAGGSLRDVQLLAGHRSIQTTQGYIDGDSDAQRRLVGLI